jgi:SulP family sulfate permease
MLKLASFRDELRQGQLLLMLIAGGLLGFTEITFVMSVAGLLFVGPLAPHFPIGAGLVLLSSTLSLIITSLFNKLPNAISTSQELPALILAVMLASLATNSSLSEGELLATAIVTIALSGLLTGIAFFVIGHYKLASLVRFVPYQVIGGFLAGTGWLLVAGSIGTMANYGLDWGTIEPLLQPSEVALWLPGVIMGFYIYFGERRINHYLALPAILVTGLILYFAIFVLAGLNLETGIQQGFLLGELASEMRWEPILYQSLATANWGLVLSQAGAFATLISLSLISILLGLSSLEVDFRTDIDVDAELQASGLANIASGLAGGLVGFQDLLQTSIAQRMGVRGRLAAFTAAGVLIFTLFFGSNILTYFPKALLGGLIFYQGVEFLNEWVIQAYKKFSRVDYAIIWLILLAIAFFGLVIAVSIGLLVTVLVFVWRYSHISIFHQKLSGSDIFSNVERSPYYQEALSKLGGHTYILELEGFIFFGTAYSLVTTIRERVDDTTALPLKHLVLSFNRVRGVDASAILYLEKILQMAVVKDFMLVFVDFARHTSNATRILEEDAYKEHYHFVSDLDRALEWCENRLMEIHGITQVHIAATILFQLKDLGFDMPRARKFMGYLERQDRKAGEYLIYQGEDASDLYFIELGQVTIFVEGLNEQRVRLRTMGIGTIVGEISFFLEEKRTASVIVDIRSFIYRLSRESLERMTEEDNELATFFNEIMLKLVMKRLVTTNNTVAALHR